EPRGERGTSRDDALFGAVVAEERTKGLLLAVGWPDDLRDERAGSHRRVVQLLGNAHWHAHGRTGRKAEAIDQLGRILYRRADCHGGRQAARVQETFDSAQALRR